MELKRVALSAIKPYPGNPRINDEAVDAVAESIRQCGYCAPIVVDENMVILAGHTRHDALRQLGWHEVEVCIVPGLTNDQKRKYRILDNKTNELAKWDFEALALELEGLDFDGFDFGFASAKEEPKKEREEADFHETISVVVDCDDDEQAEELFSRLNEEGYRCRISTL